MVWLIRASRARDHKLNPYQHTPAQLKRKHKKVATSLALVQDMVADEDDEE